MFGNWSVQQQPFHGEPTLADARTATSTALMQHTSKMSANFPSVTTKTQQTSLKKETLDEDDLHDAHDVHDVHDVHDATPEDEEMEDDDDDSADTRSSTSVISNFNS